MYIYIYVYMYIWLNESNADYFLGKCMIFVPNKKYKTGCKCYILR